MQKNTWGSPEYSLANSPRSTSQVAQWVKNLPFNAGDTGEKVLSLGWGDLLEEEMATHSSILAWQIPLTEEPGRSMGSQSVRHNWALNTHTTNPVIIPSITIVQRENQEIDIGTTHRVYLDFISIVCISLQFHHEYILVYPYHNQDRELFHRHRLPDAICVWKWKCSCSVMSDSVTPWTVAYYAPLSMGFSRQEYWSGLAVYK